MKRRQGGLGQYLLHREGFIENDCHLSPLSSLAVSANEMVAQLEWEPQ